MAVNHCRCAFLWYFLLHKQKKVHKIIINEKSLVHPLSIIHLSCTSGPRPRQRGIMTNLLLGNSDSSYLKFLPSGNAFAKSPVLNPLNIRVRSKHFSTITWITSPSTCSFPSTIINLERRISRRY